MSLRSVLLPYLLILSCLLPLSACSSSLSSLAPLPLASSTEYFLDAGDEVRVFVYGMDALNNNFTVSDSGYLSLPLVDRVEARGKTIADLEQAIKNELLAKQILVNPNVNVQPVKLRPFYILGEVNSPGEYSYRPGMTVLSAASVAGGFTFRADQRAVSITRTIGSRNVTGSADENTPIQPGDRIKVVEKWF